MGRGPGPEPGLNRGLTGAVVRTTVELEDQQFIVKLNHRWLYKQLVGM